MSPATSTVLQVRDARKLFGEVEALRGASLDLMEGEILSVLGPNGAGKTTLIRSLCGRMRLDGGQVELFGQPVNGAPASENLTVVSQEMSLYPLLSARENLEIFGRINRVPLDELKARVDWALEWTDLAGQGVEPVETFSTAMRRRLNLACCVMHGPRVLLLDEPAAGMDASSRNHIHDLLAQLRSTGYTLLFTTNQIEEAETRSDRIVILHQGAVAATGTFQELVENTVGTQRLVTLKLERPPERPVDGFEPDESGLKLRAMVRDVAVQLPVLLVRAQAAACRIENVEVHSPSLQSVFIHLTGTELR